MSISFSDTTNKDGLIQRIEQYCGFNDGEISSDSTLLAQFTGKINVALDRVFDLIYNSEGNTRFDDSNFTRTTGWPQTNIDLVSGTRSYALTIDADSNLVVDVYRLFLADSSGNYRSLQKLQSDDLVSFYDGLGTTGMPRAYARVGKYINFDVIPDYSYTNGIKVFVKTEGSYFNTTDTTKVPGINGLFHNYLALVPSYEYCFTHQIPIMNFLKGEINETEKAIQKFYNSMGNREEKMVFRPFKVNSM